MPTPKGFFLLSTYYIDDKVQFHESTLQFESTSISITPQVFRDSHGSPIFNEGIGTPITFFSVDCSIIESEVKKAHAVALKHLN